MEGAGQIGKYYKSADERYVNRTKVIVRRKWTLAGRN